MAWCFSVAGVTWCRSVDDAVWVGHESEMVGTLQTPSGVSHRTSSAMVAMRRPVSRPAERRQAWGGVADDERWGGAAGEGGKAGGGGRVGDRRETLSPCRSSSRGTATVGPMPISSGAQPQTANPLNAPSGVQPARWAAPSSISTHALAPSESCEALPAVTVARGSTSARTGASDWSDSNVVDGRLHSSLVTV